MEHAKSMWASKTVWAGILTALVGFLTAVGQLDIPAGWKSWLLLAVGGLNIVLRLGTTVPVKL